MQYPSPEFYSGVLGEIRRAANPGLSGTVRKYISRQIKRDQHEVMQQLTDRATPGAEALAHEGMLLLPRREIPVGLVEWLNNHPWGLQGTLGLVDAPERYALADRPKEAAEIAITDADVVVRCPGILDFANDPVVLSTLARYFRAPPTLINFIVFRSRPGSVESVNSFFHQDRDDFQFAKLGIYLTDVGPDNGPHHFIRHTHDWQQLVQRLESMQRSNPEVVKSFLHWLDTQSTRSGNRLTHNIGDILFPGCLEVIVGPAGTRFLVDTKGLHRGATPTTGERICLFLTYGLLPDDRMAYPRIPFAEIPESTRRGVLSDWHTNAVKRYVNRLYVV